MMVLRYGTISLYVVKSYQRLNALWLNLYYYYYYYYYFIRTQTWYNKTKINIKMKKAILVINTCYSDRVNK